MPRCRLRIDRPWSFPIAGSIGPRRSRRPRALPRSSVRPLADGEREVQRLADAARPQDDDPDDAVGTEGYREALGLCGVTEAPSVVGSNDRITLPTEPSSRNVEKTRDSRLVCYRKL